MKDMVVEVMEVAEKIGIDVNMALLFAFAESLANEMMMAVMVKNGKEKTFEFLKEFARASGYPLSEEQEQMYEQRLSELTRDYEALSKKIREHEQAG